MYKRGISLESGVARLPCALGQEIFLHPPSTKTTEFEVKMGAKVRMKQKQNIYCSYFVLFLRVIKRF